MSETLILSLLGAGGTVAISLLGLIWSELRAMRNDFSMLDRSHSTVLARLDAIEGVLSKLPCYREFVCPNSHD
jgi:hypothetical protein